MLNFLQHSRKFCKILVFLIVLVGCFCLSVLFAYPFAVSFVSGGY